MGTPCDEKGPGVSHHAGAQDTTCVDVQESLLASTGCSGVGATTSGATRPHYRGRTTWHLTQPAMVMLWMLGLSMWHFVGADAATTDYRCRSSSCEYNMSPFYNFEDIRGVYYTSNRGFIVNFIDSSGETGWERITTSGIGCHTGIDWESYVYTNPERVTLVTPYEQLPLCVKSGRVCVKDGLCEDCDTVLLGELVSPGNVLGTRETGYIVQYITEPVGFFTEEIRSDLYGSVTGTDYRSEICPRDGSTFDSPGCTLCDGVTYTPTQAPTSAPSSTPTLSPETELYLHLFALVQDHDLAHELECDGSVTEARDRTGRIIGSVLAGAAGPLGYVASKYLYNKIRRVAMTRQGLAAAVRRLDAHIARAGQSFARKFGADCAATLKSSFLWAGAQGSASLATAGLFDCSTLSSMISTTVSDTTRITVGAMSSGGGAAGSTGNVQISPMCETLSSAMELTVSQAYEWTSVGLGYCDLTGRRLTSETWSYSNGISEDGSLYYGDDFYSVMPAALEGCSGGSDVAWCNTPPFRLRLRIGCFGFGQLLVTVNPSITLASDPIGAKVYPFAEANRTILTHNGYGDTMSYSEFDIVASRFEIEWSDTGSMVCWAKLSSDKLFYAGTYGFNNGVEFEEDGRISEFKFNLPNKYPVFAVCPGCLPYEASTNSYNVMSSANEFPEGSDPNVQGEAGEPAHSPAPTDAAKATPAPGIKARNRKLRVQTNRAAK